MKKMILREFLAEERTILANQRTLLSYLRTGLAFFAAGASLIKLFEHILYLTLGGICIIAALMALIMGVVNYRKMQKTIIASLDAKSSTIEIE